MKLSVVSDDGDVLRLQATGRITQDDLSPSFDQMRELLGAGGYTRNVLLSLADVDFIDTSGISWLLACHKRFREGNGKLVIHSVVPMVLEVLKMLRLNLVFRLADNAAAALDLLREE
jgi:anti-anti-sigma factor